MLHPDIFIQRYRRTDGERLGEWLPTDSSWKTVASSGLVAHDIYHHLPSDVGTFAQEVAALGAEWYVDTQPLDRNHNAVSDRAISAFERSATDSLLNALDSREKAPFLLPIVTAGALSDWEMTIFRAVCAKAYNLVVESLDARARLCDDFENRFVLNLLWGYEQARARFPDQKAVRAGRRDLTDELNGLSTFEVPYGHEVAIKLSGYQCTIEYADADAPFLAENDVVEAVWMTWHSYERGYPAKELTLHANVDDYINFVDQYFMQNDPSMLEDEDKRLPKGETNELCKAYVISPETRAALATCVGIKLPLTVALEAPQTPRGVLIL
jgi:hypothetical protein